MLLQNHTKDNAKAVHLSVCDISCDASPISNNPYLLNINCSYYCNCSCRILCDDYCEIL